MLTAFTLVIVLGVGGMLLLFWLAGQNEQRVQGERVLRPEVLARAEARRLARLYERNGAWTGVDLRLRAIERELRAANLESVALLDAQGRVVTMRPSSPGQAPPPTPPIGLPGDAPGGSIRVEVPLRRPRRSSVCPATFRCPSAAAMA